MPKPKNSLLNKQFCEVCSKDITKSYFSKHLQSQGHLLRSSTNQNTDMKDEHQSSEDELKDFKNIKLSSSESEITYKEDESIESEQSSEAEQESPVEVSTDEEKPIKKVNKPIKKPQTKPVSIPKKAPHNVKPSPKRASKYIYELSSSSEEEQEPQRQVKGSNFIRFIRELDQGFNVNDKNTILDIYNDVMGFKKSKLYIPSQQKNKLRRYLDKFQQDNDDIDEDEVNGFMLKFVNEL
jgi:hypothetical protein